MNIESYATQVTAFSTEKKVDFYLSFSRGLTVICRAVWSDDNLSEEQKIEGMKWLNEILHTLIAKAQHELHPERSWSERDVIATIAHWATLAPFLEKYLQYELERSLELYS